MYLNIKPSVRIPALRKKSLNVSCFLGGAVSEYLPDRYRSYIQERSFSY